MGLPIELLLEMYDEGVRLTSEIEKERRCEFCRRWFKSKRGKSIHLYYCKTKKLKDILDKTRFGIVRIHAITPYPDVDNKIRNISLGDV